MIADASQRVKPKGRKLLEQVFRLQHHIGRQSDTALKYRNKLLIQQGDGNQAYSQTTTFCFRQLFTDD